MSKGSIRIWRVVTRDDVYPANVLTHFLRADSPQSLNELAIKNAMKRGKTLKGDPLPEPYVTAVELIGELDN